MKNAQSRSKQHYRQETLTTSDMERIIRGARRNRSCYIHNLLEKRLLQPLDTLSKRMAHKAFPGSALQARVHKNTESKQGI